eukprot:3140072-Pyramimonas_sp.AAC.1
MEVRRAGGRMGVGRKEERGAVFLQNEGPTPQDGWENVARLIFGCSKTFRFGGCAKTYIYGNADSPEIV